MSVYLRPGSPHYWCEFYIPRPGEKAKRYRLPTGEVSKRRAAQVEAELRAQHLADAGIQAASTRSYIERREPISVREAFGRFWNEKASLEKGHKTVMGQLARMMAFFGPNTPLDHITTNELTAYQAYRRKDGVKDRTISAEVPELLQRVYRRASLWRVELGEEIDWKSMKIGHKRHRTRSASREEIARLLRQIRWDYRPIIRFALLTGLRKQALLLRRDQVQFESGQIIYGKKSKIHNDVGILPITEAMEEILRKEIQRGGSNCEYVFTYAAERTRQGRIKGRRYPITYNGLGTMMKRAVAKSGVQDWRALHDLRHTAATNVLRRSKNLKAVQHMLGHSDIAQTSRYAHVLMDDVRDAMSA